HEPELLILDEPFSGFDPVNAELIKNEILELNRKGTTVIFSTHRMESVEELCDSIALLNLSKKLLDGKVKTIRNSFRDGTYLLEYTGEKAGMNGNAPFSILSETVTEEGHQVKLKINSGSNVNNVLQYMLPMVSISKVEEVIPTMNEIFIKTVSGNQ
ncbi:MAG: ATP-binding cassette protein, partial [Flavipsychrobacter sp.]|nr:ATP-binding cassette protein [Flavipsychrobacter sp.]